MSFCQTNIIKKYGYMDKDTLDQAYKYVKAELGKGLDGTSLMNNLRVLMQDMHESVSEPFVQDMKTLMKMEERLGELNRPEYKHSPIKAVKDWLLAGSSVGEGTGTSVEQLKNYYRNKFVHSLDMALISRDPEIPALMKQFTSDQWVQVRKAQTNIERGNPAGSGNPVIDAVAELFVHHNETLYAAKEGGGLAIKKNPDYGFKRRYNGIKIQEAGLKQFAANLLNSLDLKKSRLEGVTPENIQSILRMVKDPTVTDAEFEARAAFNPLIKEVFEDYDRWTKTYDPYSEDNISKMLFQDNKGVEAKKQKQLRSYAFKDAESEMFFMKNYGEYGDDIYKYIKADSRTSATEVALIEKFGPKYHENFKAILDQVQIKSKLEGTTFNRQDAETAFDLVVGRIIRAPHTLADVHTLEQRVAYGADLLKNVTSTATLALSAVTQLLDIPQTAFMYTNKSNQNMITKWGKLAYHSLAAVKDAITSDPKYAAHIVDIAERTIGEIDAGDLRRSGAGKFADKFMLWNASQLMNRYSSIINIRLYDDLLKSASSDGLKASEKFLGRYNLNAADMAHASPLLTQVDSPLKLEALPLSAFENNPRGMTASAYREKLSKGMYLFVNENFKQGSPAKGLRQVMDLGAGTDRTKVSSSLKGMILQFKGIPIEMMQSARQLNNLTGQFDNKVLNGTYLLGSNFAIMTTGFMMVDYLKTMMRNGFDMEKTEEEYFKYENFSQKVLTSYMKGGAFSFLTEPLVGAEKFSATNNPITKFVATPSVSVPYEVTKAAYGMVANTLDDKEYVLRKKQIKEVYRAAKLVVPGYSALQYVPILDVKTDVEENIIDWLDSIGE
jgi:hypothetical protein